MQITDRSPEAIKTLQAEVAHRYQALQNEGLNLDLTRGKPAADQLDLSNHLDGILQGDYSSEAPDVRNYGDVWGIPEARRLGAEIMGTKPEEVLTGGNASLTLMFLAVLYHMQKGWNGPESAWSKNPNAKMIFPVPGYDRHFAICETLGLQMVTVPMTDDGPDMDVVEELVRTDPDVIGIWGVPKYSNPTGCVYSDDVVDRIAGLGKIANPNFKILMDNAYAVHDLADPAPKLPNMMDAARRHGTENSLWIFASTSKITFSGGGISWVAASPENLAGYAKYIVAAVIGFDRVNQLRHARMFPDMEAVTSHMAKHRNLIKPKFDVVIETLARELSADFGSWNEPEGGYFLAFDSKPGLATEIIRLAAEAGVKLTPAGSTFPYKKDPQNSNIRIAPTAPPLAEISKAIEVFAVCVQLATLNSMA